jgi:DNA-directed RNA polymerase specialized sigma24 family protein
MSPVGDVTVWLALLKAGDRAAAQPVWEGYFRRLVALARKKLGEAPRRAADEEDVALSAFDSFCRGAERGRFPKLEDRHDLWQLLVVITSRKAADAVAHERRRKRGGGKVRGESVFAAEGRDAGGIGQVADGGPTPEFAAEVAEECGRLLGLLGEETLRRVATLKLEGYTNEEIATHLGCSLATVERKLRRIRHAWEGPRGAGGENGAGGEG